MIGRVSRVVGWWLVIWVVELVCLVGSLVILVSGRVFLWLWGGLGWFGGWSVADRCLDVWVIEKHLLGGIYFQFRF